MSIEMPSTARTGFLRRKVLGVPVLYLLAALVVVLAIVAWRVPSRPGPTDTADTPDPGETDPGIEDENGGASVGGQVYPVAPGGTVVVQPSSPIEEPSETNTDWLRKAVSFLIAEGANPGLAQAAIQKYLDGSDLTYAEGELRDKAIRKFGLPPDPTPIGQTAPKPSTATATTYVRYERVSASVFYGIRSDGVRVKLTYAQWVALGKPAYTHIDPNTGAGTPVNPNAVPTPPKFPGTLRRGSKGVYVQRVQRRVNVKADGVYGAVTERGVRNWQGSHGLPKTGVVDKHTWARMFPN